MLYLEPHQIEPAKLIVARVTKEIEEDDEDDCGCLGVEVAFEDEGIWFSHEESINVDNLAVLVQALLDELEIDEPFVFSWANTCSKPRLDEFDGGACALKRGQPAYWVNAVWLAQEHFKKDSVVAPCPWLVLVNQVLKDRGSEVLLPEADELDQKYWDIYLAPMINQIEKDLNEGTGS